MEKIKTDQEQRQEEILYNRNRTAFKRRLMTSCKKQGLLYLQLELDGYRKNKSAKLACETMTHKDHVLCYQEVINERKNTLGMKPLNFFKIKPL